MATSGRLLLDPIAELHMDAFDLPGNAGGDLRHLLEIQRDFDLEPSRVPVSDGR